MIRLETPRVLLRETLREDAAAFSKFNERPEFHRYMTITPTKENTIEHVEKLLARNAAKPRRFWHFTLVEKASSDIIGNCVIYADHRFPDHVASIGYALNPDYWGQGIMTEVLRVVTNYAHHTLRFHRLEMASNVKNVGSWRVMEKCGYEREGIERYRLKAAYGWCPELAKYSSIRPEIIEENER